MCCFLQFKKLMELSNQLPFSVRQLTSQSFSSLVDVRMKDLTLAKYQNCGMVVQLPRLGYRFSFFFFILPRPSTLKQLHAQNSNFSDFRYQEGQGPAYTYGYHVNDNSLKSLNFLAAHASHMKFSEYVNINER